MSDNYQNDGFGAGSLHAEIARQEKEIERLRGRISLADDLARDYAGCETYLARPMKAIREALTGKKGGE